MTEAFSLQFIVLLSAMLTTLALPAAMPDTSLSLWRTFAGLRRRLRRMRQERISRELDERMKKYYVIDMRDLR